ERAVAEPLLRAVTARLGFLIAVGIDYLSLDRSAQTLSSGEGQRIRLATQIGAALVGVLYVLDEPSVGLHARDNARLIEAQIRLRDLSTPSSSSSTIGKRSSRQTTSSTWVRARVSTAAGSSPRVP